METKLTKVLRGLSLDGVVREGFWRRQHLSRHLNEVKVRVMMISGGRASKAEDATQAKALRQKQAWPIPGALRR